MNINANNYEEYFLLYTDNELSAYEKNLVENFVQQHPHLEEEFLMLQQSIIKPDNIKLEDKNFLLKDEGFITKNNYEEKFILYNDNELTSLEKEEIKNFISRNPSLQNEFSIFKQIKYQPDTSIFFPGKKSLLKKEEDVKVIPLNWLKALSAAVLLGFGLWTGIRFLQKNKHEHYVAKSVAEKYVDKKIDSAKQKNTDTQIALIKKTGNNFNRFSLKRIAKNNKSHTIVTANFIAKNIDLSHKKEIQKKPDLPVENNIVAAEGSQKKVDPFIKTINAERPVEIPGKIDKNITSTLSSSKNLSQTASYKSNAEQKSENYVFYNITDEQFNKSKVGVFFKKLKNVIEKKNSLKEKIFKSESVLN